MHRTPTTATGIARRTFTDRHSTCIQPHIYTRTHRERGREHRQISTQVVHTTDHYTHPETDNTALLPFPDSRVSSVFTPTHAQQLIRYGYTVIDSFLGDPWCKLLHSECQQLQQQHCLIQNRTHLVTTDKETQQQHTQLLPKHGIYEMDTHLPSVHYVAPALSAFTHNRTLLQSLHTHLSSVMPHFSLSSQTGKVQYNTGIDAACFPLHFDSDAMIDQRLITCILYLNPHYHQKTDGVSGGALVLYPLPYAPVTITPIWDRLVVFSSQRMLHRVLPNHQPRSCVTLWMSGSTAMQATQRGGGGAMDADSTFLSSGLRVLFHPRCYQHYVKYLYRDEWRQSIQEAHRENEYQAQTQAAIQQHDKDVSIIEQALHKHLQHIPAGLLPVAISTHMEKQQAAHHVEEEKREEGKYTSEQESKNETLQHLRQSIDWSRVFQFL